MRIIFLIFLLVQGFCYGLERTVLITGGAGFIGSNFLEIMFDRYPDYKFVVLDALTYAGSLDNIPNKIRTSDRFQFVHGNVVDSPLVDKLMAKADFVVHFAAETHVTRSILEDAVFIDTDVMGTRNLMAALVKHKKTVKRFIHISTSEIYGTALNEPMDETHPIQPRSPYAAAKAGADRLVYAYCCTYDIPAVILRPFNNYGPRQHPEKAVPYFISLALEGKPLMIQGSGEQRRDWVSTRDVSDAIDKALHIADFNKIKHQEINIGTGRAISVLDIAHLILKAFNLPEDFIAFTKDRPGQVECHISSTQKAFDLLGWKAKVDIDQGIQETIQWYKNHISFLENRKDMAIVSADFEEGNR